MGAPSGDLTLYEFMKPLRKAFRPYPWIRFEQTELKNADGFSDAVVVSGRFDPDCCDRSICFVTLSGYSERENKGIWFEGSFRKRLLFDIFATIAHERIHLLQDRKAHGCPRSFRHPDPVKKYFGSVIEIDAYAHTSALEEHYGLTSDVHVKYRELFRLDDPIYKRFLKKKWEWSLTLPPLCDINRP